MSTGTPARRLLQRARRGLKAAYLRLLTPEMLGALDDDWWAQAPGDRQANVAFRIATHLAPEARLQLRRQLGVTASLDYAGADIAISISSPQEHLRRFPFAKEPWTVTWIEECVRSDHVLWDVGANIGVYSLIAAQRARVIAFEPAFPNYPQLCRNVILNGCQGRVLPLPIPLAARTGLQPFNYTGLEHGEALHTLGEQIDYKADPFVAVYRQQMLAYAADDLLATFDLPAPNHLKIDVDGTELDVLRGANKILADPALLTMMIEICDRRAPASEIADFLAPYGWRLVGRWDRNDINGESAHVAYLRFGR